MPLSTGEQYSKHARFNLEHWRTSAEKIHLRILMARLNTRVLSLLLLLVAVFLWMFTGELGVYYFYSYTWTWPPLRNHPTHHSNNPLTTVSHVQLKILFLSDPHIQCTFSAYEPWLFRWDADQYLKRSFSRLMRTLRPDMVVVLGDIFAEGFKASEQEWEDYLNCMRDILPLPVGVKFVVVPGDNDIGGEGRDAMRNSVNRRYTSEFGPMNDVFVYRGVTFVKLNTVSHIHSTPANNIEENAIRDLNLFLKILSGNLSSQNTVLLSHVPLSELSNPTVKSRILEAVKPAYAFGGHVHYSDYRRLSYSGRGESGNTQVFTVPTCSYRMGQMFMGVGVAVIGSDGCLGYKVLWLPQRYSILASYVVLGAILIGVFALTRRRTMLCCR